MVSELVLTAIVVVVALLILRFLFNTLKFFIKVAILVGVAILAYFGFTLILNAIG